MQPEQMLFTQLLQALRDKGYTVYDGLLPPASVPYPFIYMGDSQCVDEMRKGAVQGTIMQTVHVYHDDVTKRGTLSSIVLEVKNTARELERNGWLLSGCSSRMIPENLASGNAQSGITPLMHGIIDLTFRF